MLKNLIRKIVPSYGYENIDAFRHQMLEQSKFTPDIAKLEQYEWQLFFAPDEFKRDHLMHKKIGAPEYGTRYQFPGFTQGNFHFWTPPAPWSSPVPTKVEGHTNALPFFPPIAKIKGEVHLIRPQLFHLELDPYRQNTVEYRRERIRLIVPYRKVLFLKDHNLDPAFGVQENFSRSEYTGSSIKTSEESTCIIRAWMYIGVPEFWNPLINGFDYGHVETFSSKVRRWADTYYNIRRPPLPPKSE